MILKKLKKIALKIIIISLSLLLSFQAMAIYGDTGEAEMKDIDEELNILYQKIIKKINPPDKILLKKAQRQWIIFRDADCEWSYAGFPLSCLVSRTSDRVEEFKKIKLTYQKPKKIITKKELQQSDEKLNVIYQQMLKRLDSERKIKIRIAQRQWIKFRDLDCKRTNSDFRVNCLLEKIKDRILHLEIAKYFYRTQEEIRKRHQEDEYHAD